jgi:hypothetical protein
MGSDGKAKVLGEKPLSRAALSIHKSHMECPGIEPSNRLNSVTPTGSVNALPAVAFKNCCFPTQFVGCACRMILRAAFVSLGSH